MITRFLEVDTIERAKEKIGEEVANYTWIDGDRKNEIVESATYTEHKTKYGPVFEVTHAKE